MNYKETIEYLYAQLPMFSRVGKEAINNNLANTLSLCTYLGNPQKNFKVIHVAGTNGKGSVSHSLAAIFQQAGYKTGLYTSPHLKDFRERIRVNGVVCSEVFVVDFVQKMQSQIALLQPSFFELTVAMAFDFFAQESVDIAIIETGLGGRLDSTNVIQPVLSIITNIAKDHVNVLGDSLAEIAYAKAGIIKENTPILIGEYGEETFSVFESEAKEKNAPLFLSNRLVDIHTAIQEEGFLAIEASIIQEKINFRLDLGGGYQVQNVRTVLAGVHLLRAMGWHLESSDVCIALAQVKKVTGFAGRWQVLQKHPLVIVDVGHNEAGIRQIVENLKHIHYHQLHVVIGFVKDKDVKSALQLMPKQATYYFTQAQLPRALPAEELQLMATEAIGLQGSAFSSVKEALFAAKKQAKATDMILVCGSVFVVAEVI